MAPPEPTHDPETARRVADEILGADRFAEPERSFLGRALDWIGDQLDRVFGGDPDPLGAGGDGGGGSAWLTVVLLVIAAALVVVAARAARRRWGRAGRGRGERPLDVAVEGHRSADDWDDLVRRLEADGRWNEAMRARFAALVEQLIEARVLADAPGRTSGEYRAELADALPQAAGPFADAAELFERAWYGGVPAGPDEASRFADDAAAVLAAAGGGR